MIRVFHDWSDRFLFQSCSLATCILLRISYAMLLIIYALVWLADGPKWFSDAGVMSRDTARALLSDSQWSILLWIPFSPEWIQFFLSLLLIHGILLLIGFFSRVQAAMIFFWLVNFQHRNPLVLDGEDTVFRLFAFLLIFLPMDDCWSLSGSLLGKRARSCGISPRAWGVRLFQIEMTLIYISAAWSKWLSESWRDGSALYYVYQLGDLYGRFPLPAFVSENEWFVRGSTWAVLFVEAVLPLLLWFRPTRKLGLLLGIGLHLTIEYAMNLFLFQWIMIVGLLSFVDSSPWTWYGEKLQNTPKTGGSDQRSNRGEPLSKAQ